MKPKLCLRVCAYYREDVEIAIGELGYPWVRVEAYAPLPCSRALRPEDRVEQLLLSPPPDGSEVLILGACSLPRGDAAASPELQGRLVQLEHCLTMVSGREIWESETRAGAYLLTPSWLKGWRGQLQRWGFDQAGAQQFFRECARELLLLDTGTSPHARAELEQMAAYVDRPYRVRSVGLDYLKLFLAKIVLELRLSDTERQQRQMLQEANRKIAEYAMAFDLLVRLSQIQSEEATISAILDLFAMLFGCTDMRYAQIAGGKITRVFSQQGDDSPTDLLEQTLATMHDDYALMDVSSGFYLRIHYQQEILGLIAIHSIAIPAHRTQYLNLGLAISNLCGLALANAQTYAALQEAEQLLRRERDITTEMRKLLVSLTAELNIEHMLQQVLIHLHTLIPNDEAILLLRESNTLQVIAARSSHEYDSLVGQHRDVRQQPYALVIQRQIPLILTPDEITNISPLSLIEPHNLLSWMGVPLLKGQEVIGILTISSAQPNAFRPDHAKIAQVLAQEMTLAFEQMLLLQHMHTLADTDPLTGLYNRRRFNALAEAEFRRDQRNEGNGLSAIFIDIDHFKRVNDEFSHAVGDEVLKFMAGCLKHVRASDIVARYGGEEFVIISPKISLQQARLIAERLRQTIESTPVETTSGPITITISMGIAMSEPDLSTVDDLIWRADQALYAAKHAGRNRVHVWGEA
ncbi:diguanylate cyclase [Chloroflexales bacterium ZM16-3]|nr:diguanylate cyclase [Chloroflexales bacterium ZM16-3]